jgi:hypothetical protein
MHARVERCHRAQIGAIPQTHAMVRPGGDDEGRRGEGESVDTTALLGHVHARRWQHRAACETEHRKRADGPSQQFAFRICREENRRVGIGGGGGGGGGIGGIGGGGVGVGGSGGGISFCVAPLTQAQQSTLPVWPVSATMARNRMRSQMRIDPSAEAETSWPEGVSVRACTCSRSAFR